MKSLATIISETIRLSGNRIPSKLMEKIRSLPNGCKSVEMIKEGCGELFKILAHKGNNNFSWESKKNEDAPVGTCLITECGVVKAGYASTFGEVRVQMFWTWSEKAAELYKTDYETTILTLIIQIGKDVWKSLRTKEKIEMVRVVHCFFNHCEDIYKQTCHEIYHGYKYITEMLLEFSNVDAVTNDVIERYGAKKDLFAIQK